MKTYLVPLDDGGTATHSKHNLGCGSFQAKWAHNSIPSVDKQLPFTAFDDKLYEWDYSRVYLR